MSTKVQPVVRLTFDGKKNAFRVHVVDRSQVRVIDGMHQTRLLTNGEISVSKDVLKALDSREELKKGELHFNAKAEVVGWESKESEFEVHSLAVSCPPKAMKWIKKIAVVED